LEVFLPCIDANTLEYTRTEIVLFFKAGDSFTGEGRGKHQFELEFHDKVVPSELTKNADSSSFYLLVGKKSPQTAY
jgi:hypothetical protein